MKIVGIQRTILLIAVLSVAAVSCRKATPEGSPAAPLRANPAASRSANDGISVCSLLPAADVGSVMEKALVASGSGSGCSYDLDASDRQRQLEELQKKGSDEGSKAEAKAREGDWSGSFRSMARTLGQQGGGIHQLSQSMGEMLNVKVHAQRDETTEAEVKRSYSFTGATVRGVLSPEKRGVQDTIAVGKEIPDVGDWAFATNVASINMGPAFSTRGRVLEARKGPWHVTVGAAIAPDPGESALDVKLGTVARTAFERLQEAGN